MADPLRIDLFSEDYAHERFLTAALGRVSAEVGAQIDVRTIAAQGGHPRVVSELGLYRDSLEKGILVRQPDLVVLASDCNCNSYSATRTTLEKTAGQALMSKAILACPNPHIERWYMADPDSFHLVVGKQPHLGKRKCDRDRYKGLLAKTVSDAGHPSTLGGVEFASELVAAMDFYRAGKNEKSLKHFVDDLRGQLTRLRGE